MSLSDLKKVILEAIRFYGQMSVQELLYLFIENPKWIVKILKEFDSKEHLKSKIKRCLTLLIREGHIREYVCDSGYRRRYGIPELDLPKRIQLKLKEYPKIKNCKECYFSVIVYNNKRRHILPYSCSTRKNEDNPHLNVVFIGSNIRFVVYKSIFLGILEENNIRLPFKNNKNHIPEFFIAIKKLKNVNGKTHLTLKFREVVV